MTKSNAFIQALKMLLPTTHTPLNMLTNMHKYVSRAFIMGNVFPKILSHTGGFSNSYILHDLKPKLGMCIIWEINLSLLKINLLTRGLIKLIQKMIDTISLLYNSLCKKKKVILHPGSSQSYRRPRSNYKNRSIF